MFFQFYENECIWILWSKKVITEKVEYILYEVIFSFSCHEYVLTIFRHVLLKFRVNNNKKFQPNYVNRLINNLLIHTYSCIYIYIYAQGNTFIGFCIIFVFGDDVA